MKRSPYFILEIRFLPIHYDLITSVLYDAGVCSFQEEEEGMSGEGSKIICYFGTEEEMRALLPKLEEGLLECCEFHISSADHDFMNSWKQYARPVKISDAIVILPSWLPASDCQEYASSKIKVILDPGYAFGSGSHETTTLCAQAIENICKHAVPDSMLDVGCGSGILSITGAKLGIRDVYGIDIDPLAVEASYANASANDIQGVDFSDTPLSRIKRRYDLVVANILSGTILGLFEDLCRVTSPSGFLLLSGILSTELDMLKGRILPRDSEITTLDEWCAVKIPGASLLSGQ